MKSGYLHLSWPVGDAQADQEAKAAVHALELRGWSVSALNPGCVLLLLGVPVTLVGEGVWVVGDLEAPARPAMETADPAAGCRTLTQSGFGRYVVIFATPHRSPSSSLRVFRDPSGGLEALSWTRGALRVVSSLTPADIPFLRPRFLSFDWRQIARYAHDAFALGDGAGFREVASIEPGALWCATENRIVWAWRPPRLDHGADAGALAAQLRAAVRAAVASVADQPLLMEISGGLDSAIVASAVRRTPGERLWINYYTREAAGDEREFARAVASHLGVALLEVEKPTTRFDPDRLVCAMRGVRPSLNVLDGAYDDDLAERALEFGATAIVTGQGGDAAFFRSRTPLVAADALLHPSTRRLWPRVVFDLARASRSSVWRVAAEGAAGLAPSGSPRLGPLTRGSPPAKRLHLRNLIAARAFYGDCQRGRTARLTHPLLLQPVLEAVGRTPTPILTEGGVDRALARQAFAADLPAPILARQGKGDMTAIYSRAVARDAPTLRAFLLDGALRKRGVIGAPEVERALTPEILMTEGGAPTVLQWVAAEAFVQRWASWGFCTV